MTTYYKGEIFRTDDGRIFTNDVDGSGFTEITSESSADVSSAISTHANLVNGVHGLTTNISEALAAMVNPSTTNPPVTVRLAIPNTADVAHFETAYGSFGAGVIDPQFAMGINWGFTGRIDPTRPAIAWLLENFYNVTVAGKNRNTQEAYISAINMEAIPANSVSNRIWAATIDAENPDEYCDQQFLIAPAVTSAFYINSSADGTAIFKLMGSGNFTLEKAGAQIIFGSTNPIIQMTQNTPLAVLVNSKYTWFSNEVEGLAFGSGKNMYVYRVGNSILVNGAANGTQTLNVTDNLGATVFAVDTTNKKTLTTGDATFDASTHGPILIDTADGHTYRLTSTNGALVMTQVT